MYNKEQRLAFASTQLSNMSPLISFQYVWKSGMRYHLRITHQLTQKSKWWKKNGNKPLFHVQTPISEPQMRIFPDEFGLKSPLPPPCESKVPVCSSGAEWQIKDVWWLQQLCHGAVCSLHNVPRMKEASPLNIHSDTSAAIPRAGIPNEKPHDVSVKDTAVDPF